jgi:hypothetical protein
MKRRFALPRETSNSAHEHQDQQNYNYEAQAATAVIAGAIEWRATDTTNAAEENKNQNNQKDCTNDMNSFLQFCAACRT